MNIEIQLVMFPHLITEMHLLEDVVLTIQTAQAIQSHEKGFEIPIFQNKKFNDVGEMSVNRILEIREDVKPAEMVRSHMHKFAIACLDNANLLVQLMPKFEHFEIAGQAKKVVDEAKKLREMFESNSKK